MKTIGRCAKDKWQKNKFHSCKECKNYSICLKYAEEWCDEKFTQTTLLEVAK